jgi:hypothetical protein
MAHPGIGEIGSGIGMTALAFDKQVLFQGNAGLRIVGFGNIVRAVTVNADRFVGGQVG